MQFSPIGIFLSLAVGTASAATNCNTTVTFSSDTVLSDDYVKTALGDTTPCIKMTNGANLDLNGHTVTRATFGDYWSPAGVECTAPGSLVTDTASTKGYVGGTFYSGIKNCEDVTGVTVKTVPVYDTYGYIGDYGPVVGISSSFVVAKANNITNNVVTNNDGVGIQVDMLASTSLIDNNYVKAVNGISVTGTASGNGPLIQYNVLEVAYRCVTTSDHVRVNKNLCFDRADQSLSCFSYGSGATASDNQCDCSSQCKITPIFTLPWY
jgi:hypothetical protein